MCLKRGGGTVLCEMNVLNLLLEALVFSAVLDDLSQTLLCGRCHSWPVWPCDLEGPVSRDVTACARERAQGGSTPAFWALAGAVPEDSAGCCLVPASPHRSQNWGVCTRSFWGSGYASLSVYII